MSGFKNGKMPFQHFYFETSDVFEYSNTFERKFAIQVAESFDNAIMEKITEIAKEQGFTDLVLIDKEFVVTALKNEIERRKRNERDSI